MYGVQLLWCVCLRVNMLQKCPAGIYIQCLHSATDTQNRLFVAHKCVDYLKFQMIHRLRIGSDMLIAVLLQIIALHIIASGQ